MEPVKFTRLAEIKRKAAAMGIKPFTPEEKAEYDRKMYKKSLDESENYKRRVWYEKENLWSGDVPIHFTFDDWEPEKRTNEQLARDLGNRAWTLANKMLKGNIRVIMVGQPGTGKTSLALAMADYLQKQDGRTFIFISTNSLADLFNQSYDGSFEDKAKAKRRLDRLKDKAKTTKLLILDDFGTEAGSINSRNGDTYVKSVRNDIKSWIYNLADARYTADSGSTIITTNYNTGTLGKMYSPKLLSRLVTKNAENALDFSGMEDVRSD